MSELPLLFSDVARWYAVSTVALGIRTGLVDALLAGGGTADELAAAAGVDPDNAARWADAMVTGGYATLADGRYAPVRDALGLIEGGSVLDVRAIVELLVPLGGMLPRVVTAVRDGRGISSAEFQAALGMTAERVNVPMSASCSSPSGSRVTRSCEMPSSAGSTSPRSGREGERRCGSSARRIPPRGSSGTTWMRPPSPTRMRLPRRKDWTTSGSRRLTARRCPKRCSTSSASSMRSTT